MGRLLFRLALVALGAFLYSRGNSLWLLCVIALAWSLLQQQLAAMLGVVGKLTNLPQEHDANSVLVYTFSLEQVFEHSAVDALFGKLQKNSKAPAATLDDWRKLLLESYARKYAPATSVCEVRFNIKNNVLFVNGEVDFGDHLYHELEIPFRWDDGKPQDEKFLSPDCESQLAVRVLVVNGILVLQVGRFDKEYSPRILHGGSLAAYETFAAITSFPLMYFSYRHGIPIRYLNLVAKATPSYKASHDDRADQKKKLKERYTDWQTLHREIASYRILCDDDNPNYSVKQIDALQKSFETKRDQLISAEGFETHQRDDEDGWRYPDSGHEYWNRYGTVFFRNMNANRDSPGAEHWFTDYYEEQP